MYKFSYSCIIFYNFTTLILFTTYVVLTFFFANNRSNKNTYRKMIFKITR